MINPLDPTHRVRLSRAVDNAWTELVRFHAMRENTVRAYLGVPQVRTDWDHSTFRREYEKSLPKGNLLQMSGLQQQVNLAYGEPEFDVFARVPEHYGMAFELGPALNRMAKLLDLGETSRMIAGDSYFGYGLVKVAVGRMPLSAQAATGQMIGPCVWRVSQYDFLYDITARDWSQVGYVGDIYTIPLNEAIEMYPLHADRLYDAGENERLDAPRVMARTSRYTRAEDEVRLCDIYFPAAQVVATWLLRNDSFSDLAEEPLHIRDYDGHWSGVYGCESHLYSPDELIPVAQSESTKAIHFLFNDLFDMTADQARNAKYNPVYQQGSEKDMRKLWEAADRQPVGILDPTRVTGGFEIPGPTQSQTNYMGTLFQLFKQFNIGMDEPQRAPTAKQGELWREATNAVVAESRRKHHRLLQLIGYKLGHLLINDTNLTLPGTVPLRPGSNIPVDVTWQPPHIKPRVAKIDDFDISINPHSTPIRTPEQRLAMMNALAERFMAFVMMKMQGAPINLENIAKSFVKLSGEPEFQEWIEEMDPMFAMQKQSSMQSPARQGVGEYTRHNVSEKTSAGALEVNLSQAGSEPGEGAQTRFE